MLESTIPPDAEPSVQWGVQPVGVDHLDARDGRVIERSARAGEFLRRVGMGAADHDWRAFVIGPDRPAVDEMLEVALAGRTTSRTEIGFTGGDAHIWARIQMHPYREETATSPG